MTMKTVVTILWLLITVAVAAPAATEDSDLSHITATPQEYYPVVIEAYKSLPRRLQEALQGGQIEAILKNGDAMGAVFASDELGMLLDTQSVYVQWPMDAETVSFPWGKIRLVDATRHELAHLALERIFSRSSQTWIQLIKALKEEQDDEFFRKVADGHRDASSLRSPSAMASYQSLHEYLASLAEHCERLRMPLPSGRARPMVEAIVGGGTC